MSPPSTRDGAPDPATRARLARLQQRTIRFGRSCVAAPSCTRASPPYGVFGNPHAGTQRTARHLLRRHHTTPHPWPSPLRRLTQKSAARSSPASLNAAPGTPHAAEPGSRCFPPPGQEHPFHIVRTTCGPYSPVPREAGAHHVHPTVQPLYYCASLRMLCARDSQSPSIRLPAQSTPTRQSLEVRRRRSSPCPQPRPSRYSPVISFSKVRNCHPSPSPSPAQSPSHVSIVSRHLAIPKHTPTPPFARRRQPGLWTALHRRPREPCASVPAATC